MKCWLAMLLALLLAAGTCQAQKVTFTKMWKGEELWQFRGKTSGGIYKGGAKWLESGGAIDWHSMPGVTLTFQYPGKGPLPKPIEFVIPLGETLPLGGGPYRLFVKNFYRGEMEATVGDVTRPLKIVRFDWTAGETFEPNAPADKITLRCFPSSIVADNGIAQHQNYLLQGVFLTTETDKVPVRAGEIAALLPDEEVPARKGNYVQNGGFEAGLYPWGKQFGKTQLLDSGNLDASTAGEGKHSLRLPVSGMLGVETKMMRIPAGPSYTLSFYAKADAPLQLHGVVRGMGGDLKGYAPSGLAADAAVGTDWKRFSATGEIKALPGALHTLLFETKSDRPATLWIDGVQLQEGALSDFAPRDAAEVGAVSHALGNILYEGEPAEVALLATAAAPQNAVTAEYRIVDYWGSEVEKGAKTIALTDRSGRSVLPLPASRRGAFRLLLTTGENTSEMVYSVLPSNPHLESKYPAGTLGVDTHFDPKGLAILKRANFNWVLSKFLARWYEVEPEQDKFVFDEPALRNADAAHMMVVLQPLNLPRSLQPWLKPSGKPKGGGAWTRKEDYLREWGAYLEVLATRYKRFVKHWEIENEPNAQYTTEEYAQLLKIARDTIKKADPEAQIVGFSGGGFRADWFDEVAQRAGPASFDAVSVHIYTGNSTPIFEQFSAFLKKSGKPGWNTETGSTCPTFFTTLPEFEALRQQEYRQTLQREIHVQTVTTAKNYLLTLSAGGMEKYFYYFARFVNGSPSQPTRWFGGGKDLVEYDGSLRSNAVALSIGSHFLDGAQYSGPAAIEERIESHLFGKGKTSVGFAWAQQGHTLALSVPANGLKFYDIMGNPITRQKVVVGESPVYFTCPEEPQHCAALLKAVKVESAR